MGERLPDTSRKGERTTILTEDGREVSGTILETNRYYWGIFEDICLLGANLREPTYAVIRTDSGEVVEGKEVD